MICWTRCRHSSQNIPKLTSAHWASHQATGRMSHCGAPDNEDRDYRKKEKMGWFVPTSSARIGNNFCSEKKKRPATSPTHPLCITWLYTSCIYTDNKVKLSTKFYTSRWGTFKVHHHPQSTWLYTTSIYTDIKVKLSTKVYINRWVRFKRHHPSQSTWLYTSYIYTDNKVKLSVYPYKRMRIVTTAAHPIFSFHGIPLFLFSSLILSSKPHICT